MDDGFADRARRIQKTRGSAVVHRSERIKRRGRLRPFWLLLGTVVGLYAITNVRIISRNYDALRALADQDQAFAHEFAMRTLGSLGVFVLTLFLCLLFLLFYRRAVGFWNFAAGVCLIGLGMGTYVGDALAPLIMGPKFFP